MLRSTFVKPWRRIPSENKQGRALESSRARPIHLPSISAINNTLDHLVYIIAAQTDLAARLQVRSVQLNQNSICRIEKGRSVVTDYELLIIADALDVSVTDLLMRSESST